MYRYDEFDHDVALRKTSLSRYACKTVSIYSFTPICCGLPCLMGR